ncbi:MAG: CDP-alcohol phosphatidyltransferase family protein [Flavobacteriales bacterium]
MNRSIIPNLVTTGNLVCGCFAIITALQSNFLAAALFIYAGALCDFLDGFVARILKAQSEIGKQLDSLSDLVTFGLAPAAILFQLINIADFNSHISRDIHEEWEWLYPIPISFLAFILVVFTAWRLAKFNVDTRQTKYFFGLPSPASGIFFASLALLAHPFLLEVYPQFPFTVLSDGGVGVTPDMLDYEANPSFLIGKQLIQTPLLLILTGVFSLLLVAPFPIFSLKFRPGGFKANKLIFFFLIFCLLIILAAWLLKILFAALPIIILLYPIISLFVKKWFVRD